MIRHPLLSVLISAGVVGALALTGCAAVSEGQPLARSETSEEMPELPRSGSGVLSEADGFVPTGVWLTLDDDVPAITNLDPDLRSALDAAAVAAEERGTPLSFTDGWRSRDYQQHLFDDAVVTYGSEEEASRWVKRPDESQHVLGLAVDIATADAMDFLSRFGAEFGLCQIYANEAWHFELVPGASGDGCPALLSDSAG